MKTVIILCSMCREPVSSENAVHFIWADPLYPSAKIAAVRCKPCDKKHQENEGSTEQV